MTTPSTHYTDYMILEADAPDALSREVVFAIHDGWQPLGGLVVLDGDGKPPRLLQPMVKQADW